MAQPTRVLIADDSATARFLLAAVCREDPDIDVVAEVASGEEAVTLSQRLRPDIIVMDVHMPGLDGFAATRRIMVTQPTPVLIVTASIKPEDVALALRAVEAGAVGASQKPPGPEAPNFDREARAFRRKVKGLAHVRVIRRYEPRPARPMRSSEQQHTVRAVGIGASTGGPVAVRDLLRSLPATFGAPIAVVQHIAAGFAPGFARWLDSSIDLHVKIAEHGEAFEHGRVYVAPDEHHLVLATNETLALDGTEPVGGFRPSASILFASLAKVHGDGAVGVILTGLGSDGLTGLRELHGAGGCVLAQDPATAVAPSMPAAVVLANLADMTASVETIGAHLAAIASNRKATG